MSLKGNPSERVSSILEQGNPKLADYNLKLAPTPAKKSTKRDRVKPPRGARGPLPETLAPPKKPELTAPRAEGWHGAHCLSFSPYPAVRSLGIDPPGGGHPPRPKKKKQTKEKG